MDIVAKIIAVFTALLGSTGQTIVVALTVAGAHILANLSVTYLGIPIDLSWAGIIESGLAMKIVAEFLMVLLQELTTPKSTAASQINWVERVNPFRTDMWLR